MGCNEVIVEKPVLVEVPGPTEFVGVPSELLIMHAPSTIPDTLTWGEAGQLWIADRESIAILNAQINAISGLGD